MVANPRENRKSVSNAEEELKLLSLVDILEPLSREELAGLNWKHLDTHVESGAGIVRGATGSDLLSSLARYAIVVYPVFAALT